jgi:hypothetical protein
MTKLDYVVDPTNMRGDYDQIEKEVRKNTEWSMFDDNKIYSITGNWKEIVTDCINARL